MRIPDNLLAQQFTARIDSVTEKIATDQLQISSGIRILQPSDDPSGAVQAAALTSSLSQLGDQAQVVKQAQSWMSSEDATLGQIYSQLQQAHTLAVSAANPQSTDSSEALATQVDAIRNSLLQLANTEVNGRYLFAGYKTDTAPFSDTGGTVNYTGDNGVKTVTVGDSGSISFSHPGTAVFGTPLPGVAADPAHPSVFATLDTLSAAIRSGTTATVQASIDQLNTQLQNVNAVSAETGTREQQMTQLTDYISQQQTVLTKTLSDTQSTDIAQVAIDLQQQQNIYQATTYVTSLLGKEGLLQWLH